MQTEQWPGVILLLLLGAMMLESDAAIVLSQYRFHQQQLPDLVLHVLYDGYNVIFRLFSGAALAIRFMSALYLCMDK